MKKIQLLLFSFAILTGMCVKSFAQTSTLCFNFGNVTCSGGTVCVNEGCLCPSCYCPLCIATLGCCESIPIGTNTIVCFDGSTPTVPGPGNCNLLTYNPDGSDTCDIFTVTITSGGCGGTPITDTYELVNVPVTVTGGLIVHVWSWLWLNGDTFRGTPVITMGWAADNITLTASLWPSIGLTDDQGNIIHW